MGKTFIKTFFISTILVSSLCVQAQNAKKLYKSGKDLLKNGDYELALEKFNEAIEIDDEFSKAYIARAETFFKLGVFKSAASDYVTLSDLSPDKSEFIFKAGLCYLEAKEPTTAISFFNSSIEADAKSEYYYYRAKCNYELKDYEKALKDIEQSLIEEKNSERHYQKGIILSAQKKHPEAIQEFIAAIKLHSDCYDCYNQLAFSQFYTGEKELAKSSLEKAIALNPKNSSSYIFRSYLFRLEQKNSQALADLNKVLEFDPKNDKAILQRGIVFFEMGEFQKSINDLNIILSKDKENILAIETRGNSYYELKDKEKALADYKYLLSLIENKDNLQLKNKISDKIKELSIEKKAPYINVIEASGDDIEIDKSSDEITLSLKIEDDSDIKSLLINGNEATFENEKIKSGIEISIDIRNIDSLTIEAKDIYDNIGKSNYQLIKKDLGLPRLQIKQPFSSRNNKLFINTFNDDIEIDGIIDCENRISSIKINEIPIDFDNTRINPSFKANVNIKDIEIIRFDVVDNTGNHLIKKLTIDKSDAEAFLNNPMGRTWVVFIENSVYKNFTNLEGPKKEVDLMVKALSKYRIDNVIHKKNMTKSQMDWFLKHELKKQIIDNRVNSIMLWYAGHGKFLNNNGYWIPVDSKIDDLTSYYNVSTLKAALRPYTKVVTHSLVVTDACESGPSFYMSMRSIPTDKDCSKAKSTRFKSSQVFTSSGDDLSDGDSDFAKSFANSLLYNDKSCIPIEKIANKVSSDMAKSKKTRPLFGKIAGFADENGSFIFIKK